GGPNYSVIYACQFDVPLPIAIECVRNIRREALASFWEACHVAKQNVTKPNKICFLGLLRISFVRSIQPWKQTKTGTEVPSLMFLRWILQPHPHRPLRMRRG